VLPESPTRFAHVACHTPHRRQSWYLFIGNIVLSLSDATMTTRFFALLLILTNCVHAQNGNRKDLDKMKPVVPVELIPAAPVLSPAEAQKTFQVAPGFVIEAFAAEPLVEKPVALDFDPAGRAWVVEMLGYMMDLDGKDEKIPQGRIVILEDSDGDGKADKRTVFLDKILLPRAVGLIPTAFFSSMTKACSGRNARA